MVLTSEEIARIRAVFDGVAQITALEGYAASKAQHEKPALVAFAKAWNKLDLEERSAVSLELARLISPEQEDGAVVLAVDPHDLDIGLAASRAAEAGNRKRGTPTREPGFNAAVAEAVRLWEDRGNKVNTVNLWRDQNDSRDARPMLAFVAVAIEAALPMSAIIRATGMKRPDRAKLLQSIEARLRP